MYMDEVMENLFSLYCSTWHAVSKMFVRFFQIKQVKASKKVEQELFTKKENGKTETKRVLNNLRMPILHARKLHNSCHLCHIRYESLAFLQNIFGISALSK